VLSVGKGEGDMVQVHHDVHQVETMKHMHTHAGILEACTAAQYCLPVLDVCA
jgi:hypothetical protein